MQEYFEKDRYDFSRLISEIGGMEIIPNVIVDEDTDIEIYGGNTVPKDFLLNVLREFNMLDNLVQDECEREFEASILRVQDYQFAPSWIRVSNDEIKVEYWGIEVNSSFEKVFKMNNELLTILSENPRYKSAYYEFLEIHKNNHGKDDTREQLEEFEASFAREFLHGINNDSGERVELIRGKRLVIRKARIADADFMRSVELDEDNSPWVANWPLGWRIAKFGDEDFLQTIIEKEDGTPIGFIIFRDMLNKEEKIQLKRIAIVEKGKGYGKEALHLAQQLVFEVFGTKQLYLYTKENNLRAQSIYKATGFTPDMPDPCTEFHLRDEDYRKALQ